MSLNSGWTRRGYIPLCNPSYISLFFPLFHCSILTLIDCCLIKVPNTFLCLFFSLSFVPLFTFLFTTGAKNRSLVMLLYHSVLSIWKDVQYA